jgi:hypothetical protein
MTGVVRPEKVNTCAVVVTYKPDAGLANRIARISFLVNKLVVVTTGRPANRSRTSAEFRPLTVFISSGMRRTSD